MCLSFFVCFHQIVKEPKLCGSSKRGKTWEVLQQFWLKEAKEECCQHQLSQGKTIPKQLRNLQSHKILSVIKGLMICRYAIFSSSVLEIVFPILRRLKSLKLQVFGLKVNLKSGLWALKQDSTLTSYACRPFHFEAEHVVTSKVTAAHQLVHNCTIFLWSLDDQWRGPRRKRKIN